METLGGRGGICVNEGVLNLVGCMWGRFGDGKGVNEVPTQSVRIVPLNNFHS